MPLDAALELVRQGQKVIIPEGANLPDVIQYLVARMEDEETTVDINEQFHCHPIDGAISLSKAILEMFGDPNTTTMTVEGMFGPREQRPAVLSVNISPTETMQVLWGGFTIPQIDGKLQCGGGGRYPSITFVMNGKVKKKSLHLVKALADRARAIAKEQSIYRSKSFILPVDDHGNVNAMETKFFDVSGISKGDLIFNEELMANLQANIWTPLEASASCKAHGIKLKRGIMLAGSYGTGKTLTARVTANVANDAGWTFILVQRSTGLAAAIEFARMYAPCVIFAEDIDRAVAGAERTVDIDDVLNIIDGIQTKSEDIMTVLTSNHVERINRAMLRPGRIDALIETTAPDATTVKRLIRHYGGNLIASDDPLNTAAEALAGYNPAVIAEATQRAKLFALSRDHDRIIITDADVALAASAMRNHLGLLNAQVEDPETPASRLAGSITELMTEAVISAIRNN